MLVTSSRRMPTSGSVRRCCPAPARGPAGPWRPAARAPPASAPDPGAGHQGEPVDGTAAAGEDVHRSAARRGDQPVQVVGMLLGRGPAGAVGTLAPTDPARVVGHHRTIPEMLDQAGEPAGVHRRCDHHQGRRGTRLDLPCVVRRTAPATSRVWVSGSVTGCPRSRCPVMSTGGRAETDGPLRPPTTLACSRPAATSASPPTRPP
jgi:hypothetical protein